MAYLLDGIVIVIFITTCIIGYTRGFVKYIIAMLRTVVTVLLAMVLAFVLAQPVYDSLLKDKTTQQIQKALEKTDVVSIVQQELDSEGLGQYFNEEDISNLLEKGGDIAENLESLVLDKGATQQAAEDIREKFDSFLDNEMVSRITDEVYGSDENSSDKQSIAEYNIDKEQIGNLISAVADKDKAVGAQYIEETYAQPVVIALLKVVLFVIMYVIVFIMLTIILHIAGVFNKVPGISAANRFAGLALGVVKGGLYIALLAFIMCVIINGTKNQLEQLNTGIMDKTYLFRYFFDFFYK